MKKRLLYMIPGLLALYGVFVVGYSTIMREERLPMQEFGDVDAPRKILILGRGSEYKKELIEEIRKGLSSETVFIKIEDLRFSQLEDLNRYDVVVLLSSINNQNHHDSVGKLLQQYDRSRIVALTTSTLGTKEYTPPLPGDVDAITSASRLEDVNAHAQYLLQEIRRRL